MTAKQTKFLYTWDGDDYESIGFTREAHEQVRAMLNAVQTKRNDIDWPANVLVRWTTVDMDRVGHPDEVAINISFQDDDDPQRREVHKIEFRFKKKGIEGLSEAKWVDNLLKN